MRRVNKVRHVALRRRLQTQLTVACDGRVQHDDGIRQWTVVQHLKHRQCTDITDHTAACQTTHHGHTCNIHSNTHQYEHRLLSLHCCSAAITTTFGFWLTILYGSNCWAVSKTDAWKIDTFDQWCLRIAVRYQMALFWNNKVRKANRTTQTHCNSPITSPDLFWAHCANGHWCRCQDRGSCQLFLQRTGDHENVPTPHGWAQYSRIWDPTISHCLKQWIWPRTGLCGGCGRHMALRSLELHARYDDDDDPVFQVWLSRPLDSKGEPLRHATVGLLRATCPSSRPTEASKYCNFVRILPPFKEPGEARFPKDVQNGELLGLL